MEISGKSLPLLTNLDKGKFAVIVFENLEKYVNMNKWNRELLDKYCREYRVGVIGFYPPREERSVGLQLKGLPLLIDANVALSDYHLNGASPILRLTRAGEVAVGPLPGHDWNVFRSNHSSYQPLGEAFADFEGGEASEAEEVSAASPYREKPINSTTDYINGTIRKRRVMTVVQVSLRAPFV